MKKALIILLAIFYSFSSIGATFYIHTCMGKVGGSSIYKSVDNKCPVCGMKKSKKSSCCKDQKKQIKIKSLHQSATKISVNEKVDYGFYLPSLVNKILLINNKLFKQIFFFKDPPKRKSLKINILNCIFRN